MELDFSSWYSRKRLATKSCLRLAVILPLYLGIRFHHCSILQCCSVSAKLSLGWADHLALYALPKCGLQSSLILPHGMLYLMDIAALFGQVEMISYFLKFSYFFLDHDQARRPCCSTRRSDLKRSQ